MKRSLATLVLVLASGLALALPTPKDIQSAVNAGHYSQAESQLREVIQDKPSSAKAHYELGQVLAREGRSEEARQELLDAQRLEPSLKFASDPRHFNELLAKLPSAGAPTGHLSSPVSPAAPQSSAAAGGFPWGYVVVGGGILLLVWFLMRRVIANGPAPSLRPAGPLAPANPGYGPGNGYGPGYGQPYGAPAQGGMGAMGGAVVGGLAGMAAGYGLAKVLEHEGDGGSQHSQSVSRSGNDDGYIPIDSGSSADYGSFDAGTGSSDSWDDAGSSSSDDSW